MKIKPLNDHILIQRVEAKDQIKGGIIIPDSAKEKPQEAVVKAVGPGKLENGERTALQVKVGDKVLTAKYGGTEIKFDDQEYMLVREDDVLAIIQ